MRLLWLAWAAWTITLFPNSPWGCEQGSQSQETWDEPVNGLDPQDIRDMRTLLKCLCEEHGKTLLLSSYTLSEAEHIADTIGILVNGIVAKQTSMCEIKKQYLNGLEDYYFEVTGGVSSNA